MIAPLSVKPAEFIAQGDRVVGRRLRYGRIKATNKTFEDHLVFAFTVRGYISARLTPLSEIELGSGLNVSLRFDAGLLDDPRCAFALALHELRKLRLRHAQLFSTVLCNPFA
jgi:hypothetical protein